MKFINYEKNNEIFFTAFIFILYSFFLDSNIIMFRIYAYIIVLFKIEYLQGIVQ